MPGNISFATGNRSSFLTKSKKTNTFAENIAPTAPFLRKFSVDNTDEFYSAIEPKIFYEKRDGIIDLDHPAIANQTNILNELKAQLTTDLKPAVKEKLAELIKNLEEDLADLEDDAKFYEIHYEARKRELRIFEHTKFLEDPNPIFEEEVYETEVASGNARKDKAELVPNEIFKIYGLSFAEAEFLFKFYDLNARRQNARKIFISVPKISEDNKTLKFSTLYNQMKYDFWQTRNENDVLTEYSSKVQILGYSSGSEIEAGHNCYQQITRYKKFFDKEFNKINTKGFDIMLELPGANPLSVNFSARLNELSYFLWIDLDIYIKDGEDYKAVTYYRTRFLNDDELAESNYVARVKKYLENILTEFDNGVREVWTNSRNEDIKKCFFFINGYSVYEEGMRHADPYVRAVSNDREPNKKLIEKNMDKIIAEIRNHYENLDAILENTKNILAQ